MKITGSGQYLPTYRMPSVEFDARWGKAYGWTSRFVGIDERPIASPAETASLMGAKAAERALDAAGVCAGDIDWLVAACGVGEQALPCTAALIHRQLGLGSTGVAAFDVNASCLSFLAAMDLVSTAISAGRCRRALIVSSEVPSAGLNWDDHETSSMFGDGAGAVVVEAAQEADNSFVRAAHMETYSDGVELCQVRAGGTRVRLRDDPAAFAQAATFEMNGRATYRMAVRLFPKYFSRLLERADITVDKLDCIIPHQASDKALSHMERILGLPNDRFVNILSNHGNQMAASIPIALHQAIEQGTLTRGDTVALIGSGAGLSFGGMVLRY